MQNKMKYSRQKQVKALSNIILSLTVLNFEFSAVKLRAFSDLPF